MFWKALLSVSFVALGILSLGFAFFDAAEPDAASSWAWMLVGAGVLCFIGGGLLARGGFRRNPPELDRALSEWRDATLGARDRRSASASTGEPGRVADTKTRPPLA